MADSVFKDVAKGPPIEVFQLTKLYNDCPAHDTKVNLGVGAYRTEEGQPWVLPVVKAAEMQMANDKTLNHEYLPVSGLPDFRTAAIKLLLGSNHKVITENRVEAFQAVGGTSALRLSASFLKDVLQYNTVYVSAPTWGNHKTIFKRAGFTDVREYRYWDNDNKDLNLNGMLEDISAAPEKSAVILHGVAHNPTGMDPTRDQWESIFKVCHEKNLFVVMDTAYQGFATGNLDEDAWTVRFFADQDIDMFIAQSFSKNFGLYNERVGALQVITRDGSKLPDICSQMEWVIRTTYSNPANHGARIVATVLNNKAYFEDWKGQLSTMAARIKKMRQELVENLKKLGTPGNWDHITKQIGMFSYTGLTPKQVDYLKSKHVFLLGSGRISVAGLTSKNMGYVTKTIDEAVRTHPKIEVLSFVELARRKLQEAMKMISTGVTIDGVMLEEDDDIGDVINNKQRRSVNQRGGEQDVLNFVKVRLSGSMSGMATPEMKTSVYHDILEPKQDGATAGHGGVVVPTDHKSVNTSLTLVPAASDNYSVETQANTVQTTVKTFSSRGAQTTTVQQQQHKGDVTATGGTGVKSIPARFQGTMMTPIYFDGLMMTPEKLESLMKDAMNRSENLSIPVEFKGGMISEAFKTLAENALLTTTTNEPEHTQQQHEGTRGSVTDAKVKTPPSHSVNVKFEGRLLGILNPDMSLNGIPVVFDGNMTQAHK